MALALETLTEIDRELESFGKPEEEIAAVVARARELAGSLDDLDAAVDELGEGREEAIAAAIASSRAALDGELRAAPPSASAASAASAPPARPSAPPPDFDDDETDVREVAEVEARAARMMGDEARRPSDIAGLSVDELFADAEPNAGAGHSSELADLFDDEPLGLEDPSAYTALDDDADDAHLGDADGADGGDSGGLADVLESIAPPPGEADARASEPNAAVDEEPLGEQVDPEQGGDSIEGSDASLADAFDDELEAPAERAVSDADVAGVWGDDPGAGGAEGQAEASLADVFYDEPDAGDAEGQAEASLADVFEDDVAEGAHVDAASAAPAMAADIADLFEDEPEAAEADAPPSVHDVDERDALSDLFDDDPPETAGSDARADAEDQLQREIAQAIVAEEAIEAALEVDMPVEVEEPAPRPRTMPPPLPSESVIPPNLDAFPAIADEFEESTNVVSAETLAAMEAQVNANRAALTEGDPPASADDFELLVDEDILELDADEVEMIDEAAPEDDADGGLISRILGRNK